MDLKRVEELIELMRQSGVTDLSLELPDFKVRITRGPEGDRVSAIPRAEGEARGEPAAAAEPAAPEEKGSAIGHAVVSPVVGVFHNGGMLDPRELVRVGDQVREGQVLAAIEAMKVPNELRAPVSGRVAELLVDDGAAVEYGQTLFVIEPDDAGEGNDGEAPIGLA